MNPTNIKNWAITGAILWALFLGVNIDGRHYGLSFGKDGVTIHFGKQGGLMVKQLHKFNRGDMVRNIKFNGVSMLVIDTVIYDLVPCYILLLMTIGEQGTYPCHIIDSHCDLIG